MRLWGNTQAGDHIMLLGPNRKRAVAVQATTSGRIAKLSALIDGLNASAGVQRVRGVIYDQPSDALLAFSDEFVIPAGMPPTWIDFKFSALVKHSLLIASAQAIQIGIHSDAGTCGRIYYFADPAHPGRFNTDTYDDGPSASFGGSTPDNVYISMFATWFKPWTVKPNEDDMYHARLPFAEAQEILSVG